VDSFGHASARLADDWSGMDDLVRTFAARGDLAHLALFLWAGAVTAMLGFVLRELAASMRRFDDFVRELTRFNDRFRQRIKGRN
jgi:hypothetical protein